MKNSEPKRVGRKQRFNAQDVITAAANIGLDRFTMSEVATEVGVAAPAVYRIFRGREDVVDSTLQDAAARTPLVPEGLEWSEAIRFYTDTLLDTIRSYRGLASVVLEQPARYVAFLPHMEAFARMLASVGFSEQAAGRLSTVYTSIVMQGGAALSWASNWKDPAKTLSDYPIVGNFVHHIEAGDRDELHEIMKNFFIAQAKASGVTLPPQRELGK